MYKASLTVAALAAAALGMQRQALPHLQLKEEKMILEYTASADEAVVVLEAETEEVLDRVQIRDPLGAPILELASDGARKLALSGFMLEARESSPEVLFRRYAEGLYDIRARTLDGRPVRGSAVLSHELLAAPVVLHPLEGATGVPSKDLAVSWIPDPGAVAYRVVLEQNENDGLTAKLPPGSSSFQVPDGILEPDTETQLEIGAIGRNGNCTLVEVVFRTR